MDSFASFDNTLWFFVGNEVVNDVTVSNAAPYVKAAALDLKSYRDSKGYRQIPVGYSGADVTALSPYLQNFQLAALILSTFSGKISTLGAIRHRSLRRDTILSTQMPLDTLFRSSSLRLDATQVHLACSRTKPQFSGLR